MQDGRGMRTVGILFLVLLYGWLSACDASPDEACSVPERPYIRICCGRPSDIPGKTCVPRALVETNVANCHVEGKEWNGRFSAFGEACCDGLMSVDPWQPTDSGSNDPGLPAGCQFSTAPPGSKVCIRCGDRICGPGENRCVCPEDCNTE